MSFAKLVRNLAASAWLLWYALTLPAASQTVVVWDFDQHAASTHTAASPDIHRALAELLTERLLAYPGTQVVDRSRLREILDEQKIGASMLADTDFRLRLGRLTGARHMIFGSLMWIGPQARGDVRLVAAETSQVLVSLEFYGRLTELPDALEPLSREIAAALGQQGVQANQSGQSRIDSQKPGADALPRFNAALTLIDNKDYAQAINALKALLTDYPTFSAAERQLVVALEKLSRQ